MGWVFFQAGLGKINNIDRVIGFFALRTANAEEATSFSALTGLIENLYLVLLVWLMGAGPGKIAVDALVARRFRR